jgi:hypothetical protein
MKKLIFIRPKYHRSCINFVNHELKYRTYSDIGDSTFYYFPIEDSGWSEVDCKTIVGYEFKQLMKEYVP